MLPTLAFRPQTGLRTNNRITTEKTGEKNKVRKERYGFRDNPSIIFTVREIL